MIYYTEYHIKLNFSMLHFTLLIIATRFHRTYGSQGQRGVAKTLWGSPTEQTMEEMLAVEVE